MCIWESSPSTATVGPGKMFSRGPYWKKNFELFFLKWPIFMYFIFLSDGGPPNVAGPGVTYPYPSLSTGLLRVWVDHRWVRWSSEIRSSSSSVCDGAKRTRLMYSMPEPCSSTSYSPSWETHAYEPSRASVTNEHGNLRTTTTHFLIHTPSIYTESMSFECCLFCFFRFCWDTLQKQYWCQRSGKMSGGPMVGNGCWL